jgi:quercetin dioxygenase-like cupin family protein
MLADYYQKYEDAPVTKVAEGIERRIIHTDNLMLVVVDFYDGPTTSPDPFHHHVHEQVSFMAEGEVLLWAGDKEPVHLKAGDVFAMKSDVPHTIQRLTEHVRLVDCFTPLREEFFTIDR